MDDFLYFDNDINELEKSDLIEYFRYIFDLRVQGYTSLSLNHLILILEELLMDETYFISDDMLGQLIRALDYLEGNQMLKRIHEDSKVIIYLEFTKEEAEKMITHLVPKTLDSDFYLIRNI